MFDVIGLMCAKKLLNVSVFDAFISQTLPRFVSTVNSKNGR
jgi:hypothetical protein